MRKDALGRLDQAMDVIESFARGDAEAVEQRQDHQRDDALGRRVGVVDRAARQLDVQRFRESGAITRKILARDRAADAFEVGGDLAPDIAAIEIVEAGMGKMRKRLGERLLLQGGAGRRRFAVQQECRGEARHGLKLRKMIVREPRLAARHPIAVAGVARWRPPAAHRAAVLRRWP